jgi:DNA topoisomerase-1
MEITVFKSNPEELKLEHVSVNDTGYTRQRRGKGFAYFDQGKKITDQNIIYRINNLRIPPNWKNVWICRKENGYLQSTGFDARGRKQYLYHWGWTKLQQDWKFDKMLEFGKALPSIRSTIESDLKKSGWPKEKVLALIVSILDETFLRIGNKIYKETNDSYGLTTLRRKHLTIQNGAIIFSFKGKSNVYHEIKIENRRFARLVAKCSELPGHEVFRYLTEDGKSMPVNSHDINEYLKEISGSSFTSKDFRTWGGTILAVKKFEEAEEEIKQNKKLNLKRAIIKKVAQELGNTIAVSEKYYIHPKVLELLTKEDFSPDAIKIREVTPGLSEEESFVLSILNTNTTESEKIKPENVLIRER